MIDLLHSNTHPEPVARPLYGYNNVALSGLCDWSTIHKLLTAERSLRVFCSTHGPLSKLVSKLDQIEDTVLGLRIIRDPGVYDPALWLRKHCANDYAIAKVKNSVESLHDYVLIKNYPSFLKLPLSWRTSLQEKLEELKSVSEEVPYTGHSEQMDTRPVDYKLGDPRNPYKEKVGRCTSCKYIFNS
jgi:hypothetical protein